MSNTIKNPAAMLGAITSLDELIALEQKKTETLRQMRRTLARRAIQEGLIDPVVKKNEPCPVCTAPRRFAFHNDECDKCGHRFYPMKRTVEPVGLEKFIKERHQ